MTWIENGLGLVNDTDCLQSSVTNHKNFNPFLVHLILSLWLKLTQRV